MSELIEIFKSSWRYIFDMDIKGADIFALIPYIVKTGKHFTG